jgi:hypothetical protein
MTTPTDAELRTLWASQDGFHPDPIVFARAVLAKWGHPLAVAGGEPVTKERYSEPLARVINAGYLLSNCAFNLAQRPGTEISLGTAQTLEACQKEWDAACAAHKALPPAPPPQAVREPLTDEHIKSLCVQPWVFDTVKQWVRIIEAAHGITKGGQHGAE